MNIFKILANGDGSINEPNVSAFLGYLLDPNADHALNYEFLKAFLCQLDLDDEFKSDIEKYDYQIFFEQAFVGDIPRKQIVDVVVLCYRTETGTGKESVVKKFIENSKVVQKIFLIENKIREGAKNEGQLESQFIATRAELTNPDIEVHSIYLTPSGDTYNEEYASAKANGKIENPSHLFWDHGEKDSIKSILLDIIKKESEGVIEPLNEYTIHTIKAFVQFIITDFRSQIDDKKKREPGEYTKEYMDLNESMGIVEKLEHLKQELDNRIPGIKWDESRHMLADPRFPALRIKANNILLSIDAGAKTRDKVKIGYCVDRLEPNSKESLLKLAERLNIDVKKRNDKYGSYCRTAEMDNFIEIDDFDFISKIIKKSIDQTKLTQ